MSEEQDECPVCSVTLPPNATHAKANEEHIASCIEGRLAHQLSINDQPEDDDVDRELMAAAPAPDSKASYQAPTGRPPSKSKGPAPSYVSSQASQSKSASSFTPTNAFLEKRPAGKPDEKGRSSMFKRMTDKLKTDSRPPEEKRAAVMANADALMQQRWGPHGTLTREMVLRYWNATRMTQHWEYLRSDHPRRFKRMLTSGYMEPIPTKWVQDRRLAWNYPEFSTFENAAEERLYYLLNNGVMPDGSTHAPLYPLNPSMHMYKIIKRGNERNARQTMIPPEIVRQFQSPGDVFLVDPQIHSHEYSAQVPNVVYDARRQALHELADGIIHGTDHLETMLLIDVSTSMTWNPHGGMVGPDGIRRFHDQPSNIQLTEHLVHRVLHHMVPRAQKEHPRQLGVDAVTFSSYGHYVGQLSAANFRQDWNQKVRRYLGGGTQVMQGWQVVKNTYFQHQHQNYGHGRMDPVFGWQPTPGMPKLSLLVFLDGEALDMDEFELELLGETWAYVTIALVGMEGCPHHHSHAIELERVARFNPHVGFFDVHGRVLERLVVQDILGSVYPVDPPAYDEILKPEYDLEPELPSYRA